MASGKSTHNPATSSHNNNQNISHIVISDDEEAEVTSFHVQDNDNSVILISDDDEPAATDLSKLDRNTIVLSDDEDVERPAATDLSNLDRNTIVLSDDEDVERPTPALGKRPRKSSNQNNGNKVNNAMKFADNDINTHKKTNNFFSTTKFADTMESDDEKPIKFKRTKRSEGYNVEKNRKYMLCDEDTDDEYVTNKSDKEDGVWVNINDLDEPFYDLDNNKPKYTILDEDIKEDSLTGDSKYTAIDEGNNESLECNENINKDLWGDMIDVDGMVNGEHAYKSYFDDEAWEVDSDAYSKTSASSRDYDDSFINDAFMDYETTDDSNNDDDF